MARSGVTRGQETVLDALTCAQRFKPIDELTVNDLLRKKKMTPCPLFDLCYCIAISSLKVFLKNKLIIKKYKY